MDDPIAVINQDMLVVLNQLEDINTQLRSINYSAKELDALDKSRLYKIQRQLRLGLISVDDTLDALDDVTFDEEFHRNDSYIGD